MDDRTDFPGRGKYKRIPPLSPWEICPLLFQKPSEIIDKSKSVNWPNVCWILGADHLTFEGVMGDFRKKMSCRLISGGKKNMQINSWEKKHPALKKISLMTYNAEKNSYTVISREKKFLTP